MTPYQDEWQPKTACHLCRRRKIKCDRSFPTCSECDQREQICSYPSGTLKPGPKLGTVHRRKRQKKDRSGGEYRSDTDASPAQQTNRNDFDFTEPPALLASANSPCTCFSFERPSCTGQSERVSSPATTSPKRRFAQDESAVTQEAPLAVHDISFIMHPSHEGLSPGRDSIMSTSNGSPGQKPLHIAESCSSLGVDQSTLKEGIKLFFDNMVAINILHEPTFWERLNGIGSAPQLHALLAAMLAFAARFYPTAVGCYTRADIGNQEVSPLQPAHLLDLAFSKVDEALKECDDDAPPLCILQALILATHCQLTHGVRGKAWRSLGMCIRLGYELNLHLVDADRLVNYPQGTDSRLWTEDEEKRRAWWAIWEMDVFGSTIRRTRPAMDWTQMETFLPVEDQDWFDEQPRPSCFMDLSPLHRWKSLQACGNESPKAWFLVINSLMKEAQVISSPRSTPRKPSPGDWQQARDNDRNQSSGKTGEFAEESSSKLELLANSMHCFTLSLPKHLQYHNQYLSFDSRGPGELISPRQLHCGIHNIYVMTQLARLMIYRYGVFGAQRSHVQRFGTYLRADGTTTGSSTTTKLTPNEKLGSRAAATPYDVENLALPMYFEATDNILSIISRSSQNHIKHINPFLASTVWLASAVQLFRMHLTQGELSRTLIKSKFEALYMTYKRCVSFWDVQTALQQNLQALEAQLTGSETSIRPNNFSPINTEVPGPRASSCQRTNEGQVGSGSYAYDGMENAAPVETNRECTHDDDIPSLLVNSTANQKLSSRFDTTDSQRWPARGLRFPQQQQEPLPETSLPAALSEIPQCLLHMQNSATDTQGTSSTHCMHISPQMERQRPPTRDHGANDQFNQVLSHIDSDSGLFEPVSRMGQSSQTAPGFSLSDSTQFGDISFPFDIHDLISGFPSY